MRPSHSHSLCLFDYVRRARTSRLIYYLNPDRPIRLTGLSHASVRIGVPVMVPSEVRVGLIAAPQLLRSSLKHRNSPVRCKSTFSVPCSWISRSHGIPRSHIESSHTCFRGASGNSTSMIRGKRRCHICHCVRWLLVPRSNDRCVIIGGCAGLIPSFRPCIGRRVVVLAFTKAEEEKLEVSDV